MAEDIMELREKKVHYKKMPDGDGRDYFHNCWSLMLSVEEDTSPETNASSDIRHRCLIDLKGRATQKSGIYLHLTKEELAALKLSEMPEEIYLYGAYNRQDVVQLRCFASIREMDRLERREFKAIISGRLTGSTEHDPLKTPPNSAQAKQALAALDSGKFYFLTPISFGYHS